MFGEPKREHDRESKDDDQEGKYFCEGWWAARASGIREVRGCQGDVMNRGV